MGSRFMRKMALSQETQENDENVKPGHELEVKEIYRRTENQAWRDLRPEDIDSDVFDTSAAAKYALVTGMQRAASGTGGLMLFSIKIQSPYIRSFLTKVFEDYKGISTRLDELTFETPFHEFVYQWDRLQDCIAEEKDETTLQHIELLQSVLNPEIQPHLDTRRGLLEQGLMTFKYLWSIFKPRIEIFSRINNHDRMFVVERTEYQNQGFIIHCKYVNYDGTSFGYNQASLLIPPFEGVHPVHELAVYPVDLHSDPALLRKDLLERGRLFEKMIGFHYKSYAGSYIPKKKSAQGFGFMDGGRIIVDAKLFYQQNANDMPKLQSLASSADTIDTAKQIMNAFRRNRPAPSTSQFENDVSTNSSNNRPLSEQDYQLCTPLLKGFDLFSHEWASFYVDQVQEVTFSQSAFTRLVLPHDYKELILAIVKSQLSQKDAFDDVIQGKGQGIIILLQGEPGVGKTLTAEATAEEMKRPLYTVSAGELGYSAGEVERNLRTILELSAKWQAVLLIDECDVFLEQRTQSNLERNKLVAVFLRLLEYYKGVMFLTTNRVSTFDPAFQSRIHLTIDYPRLDKASRKHVWRTFIPVMKADESDVQYQNQISEEDVDELSSMDLNGREIKNIVKTARLISTAKDTPLNMEHINTVLRIKSRSILQEADEM